MLNAFGAVVFHRSMVNCSGGYIWPKYMYILLYVKIVGVFHRSMVNCSGGYIWPKCMCIVLYVKLIQCSGIPYIYGQLEQGGLVYMHSAICEIYLV